MYVPMGECCRKVKGQDHRAGDWRVGEGTQVRKSERAGVCTSTVQLATPKSSVITRANSTSLLAFVVLHVVGTASWVPSTGKFTSPAPTWVTMLVLSMAVVKSTCAMLKRNVWVTSRQLMLVIFHCPWGPKRGNTRGPVSLYTLGVDTYSGLRVAKIFFLSCGIVISQTQTAKLTFKIKF